MKEIFDNRDMSETVFRNVNLHRAVFDDVNLGEARIHNANLGGLTIDDANIRGLTIFGFRVDELIEAELDRRDPERLRLRMVNLYDPECVRTVLAHLDEVRAGFVAWLRATDHSLLTVRLTPDQWSVIELLRHLLFAEDLYTNRWLLHNDEPWSKLGLLPAFLADRPEFADVGSQPIEDLEAILSAWVAVHNRLMGFVASVTVEELRRDTGQMDFGQGTVGGVLQGLAQHDLAHIRQAEAVIQRLHERSQP
jgi:uncharacterized protein YjbI with pentapeptide repeats